MVAALITRNLRSLFMRKIYIDRLWEYIAANAGAAGRPTGKSSSVGNDVAAVRDNAFQELQALSSLCPHK
jgi:hypothetical protein